MRAPKNRARVNITLIRKRQHEKNGDSHWITHGLSQLFQRLSPLLPLFLPFLPALSKNTLTPPKKEAKC